MSKNTRMTLVSTNARIDALEATITSGFEQVFTLLGGVPVAKPVAITVPTVQGTVLSVSDTPDVRCLVQANRKAFIADHDWAQPGTSTKVLAEQVLLEGQPLVGNWMIGPKRAAMVLGVDEADLIATHDDTPLATEVVVAEVKASKPAKRSKAQRKAAKKISKAPRRADGTITPKMEWALRRELALTGYDAATIDAKVEAAYDQAPLAEHFGLVRA